jgi:hypothetical protein
VTTGGLPICVTSSQWVWDNGCPIPFLFSNKAALSQSSDELLMWTNLASTWLALSSVSIAQNQSVIRKINDQIRPVMIDGTA